MTATMTPSALMTADDVASELSIPRVAVMRLIARRQLPATPVGKGTSYYYRITPPALIDYVQRGAPDLKMPPTQAGWFYDRVTADAEMMFTDAMNN